MFPGQLAVGMGVLIRGRIELFGSAVVAPLQSLALAENYALEPTGESGRVAQLVQIFKGGEEGFLDSVFGQVPVLQGVVGPLQGGAPEFLFKGVKGGIASREIAFFGRQNQVLYGVQGDSFCWLGKKGYSPLGATESGESYRAAKKRPRWSLLDKSRKAI